ncbi:PP2C family protein-serine/threonine phosphatase [Kitasatospora sp. NPDC051705]|uniref:PP2C family protein-serine/threonine phosphatase n=1 Tax=Kitasatospora sp. NPDC051705 TaxID=3364057 RepID=UPI0037AB2940
MVRRREGGGVGGSADGYGAEAEARAPGNRTVVLGVLASTAVVLLAQAGTGTSARLVLLLVFLPALLAGLGTLAQTIAVSVWVAVVVAVSTVLFPPTSLEARAGTLVAVLGAEAALVALCARRMGRERQLFRMRQSAVALQRQLLRPLPVLTPDVQVFGLYRPVEEDAMVGGDLYDVADTPYGTRVLVGDVQGKGLPAIGAGFAVLSAFREAAFREAALTAVADSLEAAVQRHNAYAAQAGESERFVTATVLGLERGPEVQAVNCGHLAPYLLRRGRVETVDLAAGVPLGLAELAGEVRTVQWFALPEDGVLVLLTDGITEAQDRDGEFYPVEEGLTALGTTAASLLPQALDGAARHWSGGRRRDDVTVLSLRRTTP